MNTHTPATEPSAEPYCTTCHGTGHYYKIGKGGPIPCPHCPQSTAPAAAVGGDYSDWLLRLAKEIHSGSERRDSKQWGHESERVRARFLRYAETADCVVRCQVRREQSESSPPAGGFVVVPDNVRRLVGEIAQWRLCMSHNDSYFGEPSGLVKRVVSELERAVDPIYPPIPTPVDPLAGVVIHTGTAPLSPTAQPSAKDGVRVSGDDVACAYQVADAYIDSKGGDVSKLDDGQWDEMLRLVLERYSQGARA